MAANPPIDFEALSRLCAAAANPQRLRILHAIARGQTTVIELAQLVGMTTAGVSVHLAVLRSLGLLSARRQANHHEWRIGAAHPNLLRLRSALPELFDDSI